MFKKGVITDEISQDLKKAADLAVKYRLDGVEIRSVWEKGPHELDKSDRDNIRSILSDAGLVVCGISSPFYKCDIDNESEIREHIEILKKSIELAHSMGTNLVRGFTFWNKGNFESSLDRIAAKFEEPIRILEKEDITLVIESEPSVFGGNARKLATIIEKIDSPLVRALWDPGNDVYDPEGEVPYPDGYNLLKPYIKHVHLKDAHRQADGKTAAVPIGDGDVDYEGQLRELVGNGYDGFVVLETHYRPKHEMDEGTTRLPKGSSFSYMGYEGTEECLIRWEQLMSKLL
jgi:sugar phosphate isomerase/epimerase